MGCFCNLIEFDVVTAVVLPHYSLLRFSGTDAQVFLHNQLTCDVTALRMNGSTYGGYCTPKGRLLATFMLWLSADGYTMLLPAPLMQAIRKRLTMYVLRSKVKIDDLAPDLACIGVFGADAAQQLAALGAAMPEHLHDVVTHDCMTVLQLPLQRCLVVLPHAQAAGMADGSEVWSGFDIAAGIPFILPATQEEFVPQMVNLDLIGGLSYTKGCYPGQEIVARTHYLGRLKQRMYRASVAAPAAAGDKLYCAELDGQSGGMIVNSVQTADGPSDALAVLRTEYTPSSDWHMGSPQGPVLKLASLPYKTD